MSNGVLKDILLAQGELDRYYEGAVPLNLWRALNVKRGGHLFALVESPFKMSNGRVRRPDITIENGWVRVRSAPRGISTFDRVGVPTGKDWVYYKIPKGTVLPAGLAVVKDPYNEQMQATHHTIAPAYDMPITMFRLLLSQLAASALKESA
jgi:hypothetical protein